MKIRLTLLLAALMTTSNSARADAPPADSVRISSFTHAGSGCPIGSAASLLSEDLGELTLYLDQHIAQAGPSISISESRKICNVSMYLQVPAGWQYSFSGLEYNMFLDLEPQTTASIQTKYSFQPVAASLVVRRDITGPLYQDFSAHDVFPANTGGVWSPCNVSRALNITSSIIVNARGPRRALLTIGIEDGLFLHFGMRWRRC